VKRGKGRIQSYQGLLSCTFDNKYDNIEGEMGDLVENEGSMGKFLWCVDGSAAPSISI
jgi:hypothetical protein